MQNIWKLLYFAIVYNNTKIYNNTKKSNRDMFKIFKYSKLKWKKIIGDRCLAVWLTWPVFFCLKTWHRFLFLLNTRFIYLLTHFIKTNFFLKKGGGFGYILRVLCQNFLLCVPISIIHFINREMVGTYLSCCLIYIWARFDQWLLSYLNNI